MTFYSPETYSSLRSSDLGSSIPKNGSIRRTPILTSGLANAALVAADQSKAPVDLLRRSPSWKKYLNSGSLVVTIRFLGNISIIHKSFHTIKLSIYFRKHFHHLPRSDG